MSDLATLDEVFGFLGVSSDPSGFLAARLPELSAQIRTHCTDWPFGETPSFVEDVSGDVVSIVLRKRPIVSITSIVDRASSATVSGSTYSFEPRSGLLFLVNALGMPTEIPWASGCKRFRVTYVAGFATVPDDVKLALLELMAGLWTRRDPAQVARSVGNASTTFGQTGGLPAETRRKLAPYRDLVF